MRQMAESLQRDDARGGLNGLDAPRLHGRYGTITATYHQEKR